MFAVVPEDHESCHKRKPRLPQSQRASTGTIKNSSALRLAVRKPLNNISISPVALLDYRRVARTLALAFDKDPFVNYVLNTQIEYEPHQTRLIKKKQQLMLAFFEHSAYECMSIGGLVIAVKDNNLELDLIQLRAKSLALAKVPFLGVACWNKLVYDRDEKCFDYPFAMSSLANIHPSSLKFNLFSSLAKCRQRVVRIGSEQLEHERNAVFDKMLVDSPAFLLTKCVWYLGDVGVIPSAQGHGFAKKLINHCLENYMVGHWCYLESSNPANRAFYEKLGWRLMKTFEVDEDFDSSSDTESSTLGTPPSSRRGSASSSKKVKPVQEPLFLDSFVLYSKEMA